MLNFVVFIGKIVLEKVIESRQGQTHGIRGTNTHC